MEEFKYDIFFEVGGLIRIVVLYSGFVDLVCVSIMCKFCVGEIWVFIMIDVFVCGVDFVGVNGVVNYDVFGLVVVYIYCVGRIGCVGCIGGVVIMFYIKEDILFVKIVVNVIVVSE